jgi:glycosyltransferase involved in cell wall biosynthesis
MDALKVSVIIPNYNHAVFLEQRIESVCNQTHTNIEIIILDDCSTDHSRVIIEKYSKHPKIKAIVFNETNSGSPFYQWKKGVNFCTGDWIWIAESDDYAEPTFIETLIRQASDSGNVGLIYCDSKIVTGSKVEHQTFADLKNRTFRTSRWSENHSNLGQAEVENYLLLEGTINNTSAVLFRADILKKANPFDLTLRYIGDKYAFVKVLAISDIQYVKEPLNYYRDPFNSKHADRYVNYFYEQFLVFSWVYENLMISRKKFFEAFYRNTRNSVFRAWTKHKFALYVKLLRVNPYLFMLNVLFNFKQGVAAFRIR